MMSGYQCGLQMKVRVIVKGETSWNCSSFLMLTAMTANQTRVLGLGEGHYCYIVRFVSHKARI